MLVGGKVSLFPLCGSGPRSRVGGASAVLRGPFGRSPFQKDTPSTEVRKLVASGFVFFWSFSVSFSVAFLKKGDFQ